MQSLIDEYVRQQLEAGLIQAENDRANRRGQIEGIAKKILSKNDTSDPIRGKANDIVNNSSLGKKFQNSEFGQNFSEMNKGINNVSNTINDVKNLPTDFAKNAVGQGMQNAGKALTDKVPSFMSNGLQNIGGKLASDSAGTLGGQISGSLFGGSGATAGATAGTTAATTGAGTAATTTAATSATGGGAAAGGTAAGGGAAAGGIAALGPAALAALAVMAVMGANRNRASNMAKSQLAQTDKIAKAGVEDQDMQGQQVMQNTAGLMQEAMNNQANAQLGGDITGGASNIENPYQTLNDYQQYLTNNGYDQNVVNGVAQGLNSGDKNIDEWIKQYAQSSEAMNNGYTIPQNPEAVEKARQIVQQTGQQNLQKNPVITSGVGKSLDQDKLINRLARGIADFQSGYQENRNTAFKPENLMQYEGDNKGFMQRLGEGIGTTARIAQNPAVQGLVAGGLSAALNGNPMAGLVNGYKFANTKNMSDMYQKELGKQGVDVNVGATGRLDAKDFTALMTPQYKEAQNNLAREIAKNNLLYRYDKLKKDEDYRNSNLKIKQYNANTDRLKANKKSGSKSTKPQNTPSWNADLAGYAQRITDPKYASSTRELKSAFINKYGVDPDKYLKLNEGL